MVAKSSIGVACRVGEGVVGGKAVGKGRLGLPLLPLSNGGNSSLLGGVGLGKGSLGLGNLGGVNGSNGQLGVESGSNAVVDRSHWETRVGHTEAGSISDILDLLQDSIGIDVGVATVHTTVGVAGLSLGRVQVGVAVVQVAELILGVELAAHEGSNGGGIGDGGNGSSNSRGSSIGDMGGSIGEAGIAVASVGVAGVVGEGRSDHLGILSQANGQQGGEGDLELNKLKVRTQIMRRW